MKEQSEHDYGFYRECRICKAKLAKLVDSDKVREEHKQAQKE